MTELYIDGTAVVLPREFSIQVKRENPLFTKNGEYTYDITLSLRNPTNAALYSHLNRLNSTEWPALNRRAVLVADNRTYINGTEVITAWTDDSVTLQLVGGNSELNYIAGGDATIGSLVQMKQVHIELDRVEAKELIAATYPETEWTLTTVQAETGDSAVVYNPWMPDITGQYIDESLTLAEGKYLPQPFLCAYLKDMFRAMGYELTYNQLEDTEYKHLVICNTVSEEWNKILEGWKVVDFLDQVEKLFNATFVIDNRKKTASLVLNNSYYNGAQTAHVTAVVDDYEAEMEEDNDAVDYNVERLSYKLPSTDFWKVQCLEDTYLQHTDAVTIPATYNPGDPVAVRVSGYMDDYEAENGSAEDVLFYDVLTELYWMRHTFDVTLPNGRPSTEVRLAAMDAFAPLNRNASEDTANELDILPAGMEVHDAQGTYNGLPLHIYYHKAVVEASGDSTDEEEETDTDPLSVIKDWSYSDPRAETVCLAFYKGLTESTYHINQGDRGQTALVPSLAIDTLMLYGDMKTSGNFQSTGLTDGLRFRDLNRNFYQGAYDIDLQRAVKLSSYDPNIYPPSALFELNNRRYVCREIEYTLDADGRKGAWTGTFYPIHLDGTATDPRWILADGRWRDNGVWLDNGRWLDDPV